MADPARRHPGNAPGPWFVDRTCINCDVSRQCAPWMFGEEDDQAIVVRQPTSPEERLDAARALLACPTGSIGVAGKKPRTKGLFPQPIADDVHFCGFTSKDSFGANAYWVRREEGNLLVDSPRFVAPLVEAFEERGGIAHILLTHGDDVADAEKYAERFGARVWIHAGDRDAAPFANYLFQGLDPTEIRPGLVAIPAPGHTRGSVVFLLEGRFLFTGDSLYYSRTRRRLSAFRDAVWYSWKEQADSLERLSARDFEWVLPGHGNRAPGTPENWRRQLLALVIEMRGARSGTEW